MSRWSSETEDQARLLIDAVVAGGPTRLASWRRLMALIAPHVEAWARGSRLLRRCRLAGEDDARAVMVAVLERLAAGDHANLRAFQARERADRPLQPGQHRVGNGDAFAHAGAGKALAHQHGLECGARIDAGALGQHFRHQLQRLASRCRRQFRRNRLWRDQIT